MKNQISRLLIAIITVSLTLQLGVFSASAAENTKLPFNDISNHWAKDNILKAYESGLVDGFPDGTFRPDDIVQADQFIVMMLRAHSVTQNGKTEFDPSWYKYLKEWQPAYLNKIMVTVYQQNFKFQQATTGYWAKPFIDFIYETPFIYSDDTVFPKNYDLYKKQIKREQASYLLGLWFDAFETSYQIQYKNFVLSKADIKDIKSFGLNESTYLGQILISGLMNGYPNKYFYPKRYVTRAEALTMVLRLRDASLRQPFKPSLTGQHYIEQDGQVYLFSDKFKHDTYKKFIELSQLHVKSGYVAQDSASIVSIYKSKDDYDKYIFMTKMMRFEDRPDDEVTAFVGDDTDRTIGISFPELSKFTNSKPYLNALYELLAGKGKGVELKSKVDGFISKNSPETEFTVNNKKFRFFTSGNRAWISLSY
ncbi:S-layer homology domain-containing protein [Paenibacillus sp. LHD-117]|uniref:S-layer homology domain-containing protein n=1 Tax=Paenibacillus sp. LHD-117 TaxID=3071412 RepID=UPI0027DECC56|nr:S-layer homology domain-containing protein [Paenibacillus sp. LHD-117]MDQ6422585.1 S-layer homology domain-containing protein [Paenibacillus sp. LHD-117]